MIHHLKCQPQFFEPLIEGRKAFEIRKNDRNYQVGDTLRLEEWDPEKNAYTGNVALREVTYLTAFAQSPGWVVMGLTRG